MLVGRGERLSLLDDPVDEELMHAVAAEGGVRVDPTERGEGAAGGVGRCQRVSVRVVVALEHALEQRSNAIRLRLSRKRRRIRCEGSMDYGLRKHAHQRDRDPPEGRPRPIRGGLAQGRQ